MIKLGLYSHAIDFAGTWRSHERIAEVLQHNPEYEVFIFYADNVNNNRLDVSRKILDSCKFVPFKRSLNKRGSESGYSPEESNIHEIVKNNKIDIFHFARSGYYEWPFTSRMSPVQIETNIFGYVDKSIYLDGTISIAKCLNLKESDTTVLIPNPIPTIKNIHKTNLREKFSIKENELVFGRIGRPDNFTPISLDAFFEFKKIIPSKYMIIGACEKVKEYVVNKRMQDSVIFLNCTNDDDFIDSFYNSVDVFAHYRSDGEICSTALCQSMMYGVPFITHFAGQNGQFEWLGPNICVNNANQYYEAMKILSDTTTRSQISKKCKDYAYDNFQQEKIVEKISTFYKELLKRKS